MKPVPPLAKSKRSHLKTEWDFLDIGLSYTRSQQQAKRTLVAYEQRRKINQQLIQEAISTYWRAYTAQTMKPKVSNYKRKAELALERSKQALKQKARASDIELDYQQVLIKAIRRANELEREIATAKTDLARLMNVAPGQVFRLKKPSYQLARLPNLNVNLVQLDTIALIYRPELREASYQTLIRKKGIQEAVLSLIPGVKFDFGYNYTSNEFLLNHTWHGGNLNLALDLLQSVVKGPHEVTLAKHLYQFEQLKQAALSISVLTQIRIALINYLMWRDDYRYANQEANVSKKLLQHAIRLESAKQGSEQVTIRRGIEKLNSEFDEKVTFAKAQDALFKIYQSVGIDMLPDYAEFMPLESLTKLVKKALVKQNLGGFNHEIKQRYQALLPQLGLTYEEKKAYITSKDLKKFLTSFKYKLFNHPVITQLDAQQGNK